MQALEHALEHALEAEDSERQNNVHILVARYIQIKLRTKT